MIELLSLTNTEHDFGRFSGFQDLSLFLNAHGLGGLELMPYKSETTGDLPASAIVGLHLGYFPTWVDFWRGDEEAVLREFGTLEEAERQFGGSSREALVRFFRAQMDMAARLGVRYAVFHVADVSLAETLSYRFLHTDEEVCAAAVELLTEVLRGREYPFELLLENLWWPGLTLLRPEVTEVLLSAVPRAGLMLDTGHLLHMNRALKTEDEGIAYIYKVLDAHPGIEKKIRGMHLHQSLTGDFVEGVIACERRLEGTYFERLCQAYECVLGMDGHKPFSTKAIKGLIARADPDYLTHEFITTDRAQLDAYLKTQKAAMR
jgi:hypothetical protein